MVSLGTTATGRALLIFGLILHLFDQIVGTGSVPFEAETVMYAALICHNG